MVGHAMGMSQGPPSSYTEFLAGHEPGYATMRAIVSVQNVMRIVVNTSNRRRLFG